VFLLNSFRLQFCVAFFSKASLIPKVRDYFAEFLNINYLKRLSKIYQSTWFGFEYGLSFIFFLERIAFSKEKKLIYFDLIIQKHDTKDS